MKKSFLLSILSVFSISLLSGQILDTTFRAKIQRVAKINQVEVFPDNKILISGNFEEINGKEAKNRPLVKLNPDGSMDESFNFYSENSLEINRLKVYENGQVLVGGTFKNKKNLISPFLWWLKANGEVDKVFKSGSEMDNQQVEKFAALPIKIKQMLDFPDKYQVVQMDVEKYAVLAPLNARLYIFSKEGDLISQINTEYSFDQIKVLNGQSLLLFGKRIAQYSLKSNKLEQFPSLSPNDSILDVEQTRDGNILLVGNFKFIGNKFQTGISKIDLSGEIPEVDQNFKAQMTNPGIVWTIFGQNDGKVIIGGIFDLVNETVVYNLARLTENGSIDSTFIMTACDETQTVYHVLSLSDGNLVIGARDRSIQLDSTQLFALTQTDPNGFPIPKHRYDIQYAFGNSPTFSKVQVLNEDRVIGGTGAHVRIGQNASQFTVIYNRDGSIYSDIDREYTEDLTRYNYLLSQSDGSFYILGRKIRYDGSKEASMIKALPTGGRDTTFQFDTTISRNLMLSYGEVLSDGKILAGGYFVNDESTTLDRTAYLYKLNQDGTLDENFNIIEAQGSSGPGSIRHINEVKANFIFVSATFSTLNGEKSNLGFFIDSLGNKLTDLGAVTRGIAVSSYVIDKNTMYVGGQFFTNDSTGVSIARVKFSEDVTTSISDQFLAIELNIYPNPVADTPLKIDIGNVSTLPLNFIIWNAMGQPTGIQGRLNTSLNQIDLSSLPAGVFYLDIFENGRRQTKKIVKY